MNEDDRAKQIEQWAATKPYYREVAPTMERLIAADLQLAQTGTPRPGSTIEGGFINYDRAYESALWATPHLRSKLIAEQEAAEERERERAAQLETLAREQEGPESARQSIERAIQHVKDNPPPKPAPVKKVRPQPSPEFWKREKRWQPW